MWIRMRGAFPHQEFLLIRKKKKKAKPKKGYYVA